MADFHVNLYYYINRYLFCLLVDLEERLICLIQWLLSENIFSVLF